MSIAVIVMSAIPADIMKSLVGANFYTYGTVMLLASGAVGVLTLGIPYVSNIAVANMFSTFTI
jgi:hypothetical protein